MKIKDLSVDLRPREKLIKYGPHNLASEELIAILIGSGIKGKSALELANDIMKKYNLREFSECAYAIYLNTKASVIKRVLINEGDIAFVNISIRKIIKNALELEAYGLILVHNHPSGEISPSESDIKTTSMLAASAKLFDIAFIDHIIIGRNKYYSFLENDSSCLDKSIKSYEGDFNEENNL